MIYASLYKLLPIKLNFFLKPTDTVSDQRSEMRTYMLLRNVPSWKTNYRKANNIKPLRPLAAYYSWSNNKF